MTMTSSEWKDVMDDLLDGVEREVRFSARAKIKSSLNEFRTRLKEILTIQQRRHFEKELEAFLQSKPFLRGAAERYVCKKLIPALESATEAMTKANRILTKWKVGQGSSTATAGIPDPGPRTPD